MVQFLEYTKKIGLSRGQTNGTCGKIRIAKTPFGMVCWKQIISGEDPYAQTETELKHRLHFRAASGKPAAHFRQRPDYGGGAYGLREDHGGELVPFPEGKGRKNGDPGQRLFRSSGHSLEKRPDGLFQSRLSLFQRLPLPGGSGRFISSSSAGTGFYPGRKRCDWGQDFGRSVGSSCN